MITLGNPAPFGLLSFSMTTAMLMYIDMGWVEDDFEALIFGYAFFLSGMGQIIVAILEIFKGSSFSFAVFGCYGAFWIGWAFNALESHRNELEYTISRGKTALFIQWGVLSSCFFVITLRKNMCLMIMFFLLTVTFFLLAAGAGTGSEAIQKAGGYIGFLTALGAFYTGIAELINEEWGRHILPGLVPVHSPERFHITRESIGKRMSYDIKNNILLLHFRGLQIKSSEDIVAIKEGVEEAILKAKTPNNKVHVIVDYKDALILDNAFQEYWETVAELERQFYLSAVRFHVTSFGTSAPGNSGTGNMVRVTDARENAKPYAHDRERV